MPIASGPQSVKSWIWCTVCKWPDCIRYWDFDLKTFYQIDDNNIIHTNSAVICTPHDIWLCLSDATIEILWHHRDRTSDIHVFVHSLLSFLCVHTFRITYCCSKSPFRKVFKIKMNIDLMLIISPLLSSNSRHATLIYCSFLNGWPTTASI